jgi:Nuclease-related domain
MRERRPAEALIQEVLRQQATARPRTALDRITGRSPLTADATPWFVGARGELEVAALLAQLPPEWTVLHSLPVGGAEADIDHIVIGPGGVYTLTTKHHRGQEVWVAGRTFMVSGQRHPHIRNAQHEAFVVVDILTAAGIACPVESVITVVGAVSVKIRARPEGVLVIEEDRLVRWLRNRPTVLPEDAVREVVRVLEHPAMWRPVKPLLEHARAEFAVLHREVRISRRVRIGWALSPAIAVLALAAPAVVTAAGRLLPGA